MIGQIKQLVGFMFKFRNILPESNTAFLGNDSYLIIQCHREKCSFRNPLR